MFVWLEQIFWLLFFWELGRIISFFSSGFYHGDIIGMFLMFFALLTGVIKKNKVEKASKMLIKYMLLFLIPLVPGFIYHLPVVAPYICHIVIAFLLSTAVTLVVVGLLTDFLIKKFKNRVR